jgi:hypothetical protein
MKHKDLAKTPQRLIVTWNYAISIVDKMVIHRSTYCGISCCHWWDSYPTHPIRSLKCLEGSRFQDSRFQISILVPKSLQSCLKCSQTNW